MKISTPKFDRKATRKWMAITLLLLATGLPSMGQNPSARRVVPVGVANPGSDSGAVHSFDVEGVTTAMGRGNEAAFRRFFAAYFDRLLRYLLVVAGGHEDVAREALQGTLIRVANT